MKGIVVWVMIGMCCAGGLSAGELYTLEECIEMAKQHDPGLIISRNAIKLAGMDVYRQAGTFLPSLGLGAGYGQREYSRTTEQYREIGGGVVDTVPPQPSRETSSYSAGYSLAYRQLNILQNIWGYLGSKASKDVNEYAYQSNLSDLEYAVKGEYYFVLKTKREVQVAREAVKRSEELLKLYEEKYELGSASLSEVLKQRVLYGNDQLTLVTKDKAYRLALAALAVTIGLDPSQDFEIADRELVKMKIDALDDLLATAEKTHPYLRSWDAQVRASKYGLRYQWSEYLPTVTISYSKDWSHSEFDQFSKFGSTDNERTFSLSFDFPIFDGFNRERNLTDAKIKLTNARANRFYYRNLVIKDIRDAHLGVTVAEKTLLVTEETQQAAQEDYELVRAKYELGAAAQWELLEAQVNLSEAQFNRIRAEFDYNLAVAQLQNAMGN